MNTISLAIAIICVPTAVGLVTISRKLGEVAARWESDGEVFSWKFTVCVLLTGAISVAVFTAAATLAKALP